MSDKYVNIHTHSVRTGEVGILSYSLGVDAEPPAGALFSAGIHPWSVGSVDIEEGLRYLRSAPISAIGEIGLDYSINNLDKSSQIAVFEEQLEIAKERKLPVVIHCVRAYNDLYDILRQTELKAVILHGYVGSPQQTKRFTNIGCYISAGEISLGSNKTVESLKECPLDKLFAETDTSTLSIIEIYERLAEIKGIDTHRLQDIIYNNFKTIFG